MRRVLSTTSWALLSMAAVGCLLAVGCRGGVSGGDGGGGGGAAGDKVIRVVRNIGGRQGFQAHWDAWKAAFERDNPGWEMKKIDLEKLKKEKDIKKANALVIDDIITKEVLELAGNCKYIVGITTAGNLSVPKDKIIVTKF